MDASPAVQQALDVLYLASIVLGLGSLVGFIAKKINIPDIVLFLLLGIVLGPVTGLVTLDSGSALNQLILIFGAAYIILDGGLAVELKVLKNVWISLVVIATIGLVLTMFAVGFSVSWIFGVPLITALLLGAIIASTDPATLVPVFKQVHIRDRVAQTVMSESALNDTMGAIIAAVMMVLAVGMESGTGTGFSLSASLGEFARDAALGIVVGGVFGFGALILISHKTFGLLRDYKTLVTVIVVTAGFLVAGAIGGSGYMAAFIAGVIIGNKTLFGFHLSNEEDKEVEDFVGVTALIMRMFIFILLGSQVSFQLLSEYWLRGLAVVAIFIFIARPLVVFICCLPDRRAKWSFKELLFISWVRETGVIPAALAGMAVGAGVAHADLIASVTFMAILITILLQATTTQWWAAKLGLLVDDKT